MNKWKQLYCIIVFAVCLLPLAGMPLGTAEGAQENRRLAEFPSLRTEDGVNVQWLSQAGEYFQDHFGFRSQLVTAHALLLGKGLGVSAAEGVIQGTDGWLYYKDSLEDYLGIHQLSDRSLYNIAHSLAMVQGAMEEKGVRFLFTVAPNKNTLYGEHMPYYDRIRVAEEGNLERLLPFLDREGVAYADLCGVFREREEVLYHQRDSHWNNQGAAVAAGVLLDTLGKEHEPYDGETYEVRRDFEGDLDAMLYPLAVTPEEEIYYDRMPTYAYVGEVESTFDPAITTVNPVKSGSLVMYRDSFGNALLPFLADAYASAYFSRGVPYQLDDVDTKAADTLIIERAERFLPEMAQQPPVLEGRGIPDQPPAELTETDGGAELGLTRMGPRVRINGRIPEGELRTDSRIFLRVNGGETCEAFPMDVQTGEGVEAGGFCLWLAGEQVPPGENDLEILLLEDGQWKKIYEKKIKEETS